MCVVNSSGTTTLENPAAFTKMKRKMQQEIDFVSELTEIDSDVSAQHGIGRWGLKGHLVEGKGRKPRMIFNDSEKTDFQNWIDAVNWSKQNATE